MKKNKIKSPSQFRMTKMDRVYFNSIIAEFSKDELTEHRLDLVAMLACSMFDLKIERELLREEGSIIKTNSGHVLKNPRFGIVQAHLKIILALRRSLSLATSDPREALRQRNKNKRYERIFEPDPDGLLAMPDKDDLINWPK